MTYSHYGEFGDVWKHLPLAEILSTEPPGAYWESHAASGLYELAPTREQQYGVLHYLDQADSSNVLKNSPYTRILDGYRENDRSLSRYPGSPIIAMHLLGEIHSSTPDEPSFLFCDTEGDAIESLRKHIHELDVRDSAVTTVHDDGISTLASAQSKSSPDELAKAFVHLDPYWPGDLGKDGQSSWDLFSRLVAGGARVMLWYGYQTLVEESAKNDFFDERISSSERNTDGDDLWVGEMIVDAFRDAETTAPHPGVIGCGVVCGNVGKRAINRCREVGKALVSSYTDAVLPDGDDGSLTFVEPYN